MDALAGQRGWLEAFAQLLEVHGWFGAACGPLWVLPMGRPVAESGEYWTQRSPGLRQRVRVLCPEIRLIRHSPLDDAETSQITKSRSEQAAGKSGQCLLDLGKSRVAYKQLADKKQRPAVSEEAGRGRDSAEVCASWKIVVGAG
nr:MULTISPECIES: hypothetical protein [unclassified Aeromicrobium]